MSTDFLHCGTNMRGHCRTPIWILSAHRGDGKRFVVHADEKLTAFLELENCLRMLRVSITRRFGCSRNVLDRSRDGAQAAAMKATIRLFLAVLCLSAVADRTPAVSPAPGGCYPAYTTAEGCNALQSLATGLGDTGWLVCALCQ
jgi:hypothetical protein